VIGQCSVRWRFSQKASDEALSSSLPKPHFTPVFGIAKSDRLPWLELPKLGLFPLRELPL
jgi:hypothetical protein